jgi:uncharacterized DUF497 family protein
MLYEWNETKREKNTATHGVDFSAIESFVWEKAVVLTDTRKSYGEPRLLAYGPIEGRLHCVVFTVRKGIIRLISLRKANSREVKRYG